MPPLWPTVNAGLNATSAVLLAVGWSRARAGDRASHRRFMLAALSCSAIFLASYLAYHARVGSVRYQGAGPLRTAYLSVLLTHTVLAAAVPFLALRMLFLAWKERFEEHRRLGRVALPVWLYVSVTGVAVYGMLYGWGR
ncbi:MAG: DUF420 domain-containing protein [Elusimicrobia bacterium]|nr:DUF420 domain-containing protein [Elusimicrobiota bacterium]